MYAWRFRRLVPVAGVVFAVLALGLVGERVQRALAGGAQSSAGDANGDGRLDLTDAVYILRHLFQGGPPPVPCPTSSPVSTFVIVRHAEKGTGEDPGLTPEGRQRAEHLAEVLAPQRIDVLIASTLRRTQETLAPLAELKGLEVERIMDAADVVRRLEGLPAGSVAVVAHHSFTIPAILEGLRVPGRERIDLSRYDNFIAVLSPPGAPKQLLHLTY